MATGTIPMPYDSYKEFTLTKDPDATNWTINRSHFGIQGKTAYLQFVCTVTSDQTTSAVILAKLPVAPLFNIEGRTASAAYEVDFNWNISADGNIHIQRTPAISRSANIRVNVSFPIA